MTAELVAKTKAGIPLHERDMRARDLPLANCLLPCKWLISNGMAEISHSGFRNFSSPSAFQSLEIEKGFRIENPEDSKPGR
jgi:hypothetical protein